MAKNEKAAKLKEAEEAKLKAAKQKEAEAKLKAEEDAILAEAKKAEAAKQKEAEAKLKAEKAKNSKIASSIETILAAKDAVSVFNAKRNIIIVMNHNVDVADEMLNELTEAFHENANGLLSLANCCMSEHTVQGLSAEVKAWNALAMCIAMKVAKVEYNFDTHGFKAQFDAGYTELSQVLASRLFR